MKKVVIAKLLEKVKCGPIHFKIVFMKPVQLCPIDEKSRYVKNGPVSSY